MVQTNAGRRPKLPQRPLQPGPALQPPPALRGGNRGSVKVCCDATGACERRSGAGGLLHENVAERQGGGDVPTGSEAATKPHHSPAQSR